jgi:tRNA(Met) cytidine acetyltransferase
MMTQRQCIFLKGDVDWCHNSAHTLLASFDKQSVIYLSEHTKPDSVYQTFTQKQAQKQLGKEFDAVIFDATDDFNADSFGAIVGTIKAGGALLILLPNTLPESLWLKRFSHIAEVFCSQHESICNIQQGDDLPTLLSPASKPEADQIIPTADQTTAINAILKVVHGHRRRPLVLSSDRGRGKSAALGMAAAELIKQGKQSIIVTAPSLATVQTVFEHAGRLLPEATATRAEIELDTARIRFIAPDALLESDIKADLVLVDEAAAIPAPMLAQLLHKFSRIAFATTLHGYEGTGLGFAIRFKQTLDDSTPNWRSVKMTQPIRWADNDALEAFSFKALLLDAEPVEEELIQNCQSDDCQFELVDRNTLINDETSLSELFGLMVLAHYRTRPSDLQMMLDNADISVYVMRYQGHIVASAWAVSEGVLDQALADDIHAGKRRLKGHLLPQSLLAHAGITTAGTLRYQRIIRIAVHPAVQSRGIGTQLLTSITKQAECDMVGASFAISQDVFCFWNTSGFKPVRLGLHHDTVSGSHSVMMLKPITEQGRAVFNAAQQRFQQQWLYLLGQDFKQLAPELVMTVCQSIDLNQAELSQWEWAEIDAFAHQQRGFEFCKFALWLWLPTVLHRDLFTRLNSNQQQLCIMTILQQRDWSEINKRLPYSGRAEAISALRESVALLINNF